MAPASIRRKARCPSIKHPLEYSIQHGIGKDDVAKRVSGQRDAILGLRGKMLASEQGWQQPPPLPQRRMWSGVTHGRKGR